jgi:hypothetical protein
MRMRLRLRVEQRVQMRRRCMHMFSFGGGWRFGFLVGFWRVGTGVVGSKWVSWGSSRA